jgi:basic membrane protein A
MKKIALLMIVLAVFAGQAFAQKTFPVGMVTDAGTIDDKSFNQGTWEGILKAGKDFNFKTKYLKPSGTTEADYVKEIGNLYDAGFKFIVCPGFKFETAIFVTQDKYPDAKFVLIDGSPNNGKWDATRQEKVGPNTVAIFFAEHESGFIAGVAAALQLKDGEIGFIGGMEIPAVQKFNWGFQQGVAYANKTYGTKVVQKAENVIYQGSFDNVAAGQQLAAAMFDKGVKAIFAAAGGVGVGAINEAKTRAVAGNEGHRRRLLRHGQGRARGQVSRRPDPCLQRQERRHRHPRGEPQPRRGRADQGDQGSRRPQGRQDRRRRQAGQPDQVSRAF